MITMGRTSKPSRVKPTATTEDTEADPVIDLNDMAAVQHGLNGAASEVAVRFVHLSGHAAVQPLLDAPPPPLSSASIRMLHAGGSAHGSATHCVRLQR